MHEEEWGVRVLTQQRVQVSATRYRVPDVCLVRATDPIELVLKTPPMLCIEVLSPEDRFQRVQQRVQEYQRIGVAHIWVVDPESREIWTAEGLEGLRTFQGDALSIPERSATMAVATVFARIDRALGR